MFFHWSLVTASLLKSLGLSQYSGCYYFTPSEFFTLTLTDRLSLYSKGKKCPLRSPCLFSEFWLILTILYSGSSRFVHWLLTLAVLNPSLWGSFQERQLFYIVSSKLWVLVSLFAFISFYFLVRRDGKILSAASSLFFSVNYVWLWSDDVSESQNPREFYPSTSPRRILVCACTIWYYDQI